MYRRNPEIPVEGVAPGFYIDPTESEAINARRAFERASMYARGAGDDEDPEDFPMYMRALWLNRADKLAMMFPGAGFGASSAGSEADKMVKSLRSFRGEIDSWAKSQRVAPNYQEMEDFRYDIVSGLPSKPGHARYPDEAIERGADAMKAMRADTAFNAFTKRWLPSAWDGEFVSEETPLMFRKRRNPITRYRRRQRYSRNPNLKARGRRKRRNPLARYRFNPTIADDPDYVRSDDFIRKAKIYLKSPVAGNIFSLAKLIPYAKRTASFRNTISQIELPDAIELTRDEEKAVANLTTGETILMLVDTIQNDTDAKLREDAAHKLETMDLNVWHTWSDLIDLLEDYVKSETTRDGSRNMEPRYKLTGYYGITEKPLTNANFDIFGTSSPYRDNLLRDEYLEREKVERIMEKLEQTGLLNSRFERWWASRVDRVGDLIKKIKNLNCLSSEAQRDLFCQDNAFLRQYYSQPRPKMPSTETMVDLRKGIAPSTPVSTPTIWPGDPSPKHKKYNIPDEIIEDIFTPEFGYIQELERKVAKTRRLRRRYHRNPRQRRYSRNPALRRKSSATKCPYCQDRMAIEEGIVLCDLCGTAQHDECFSENSRCSIYGCGSPTATTQQLPTPTLRPPSPPASRDITLEELSRPDWDKDPRFGNLTEQQLARYKLQRRRALGIADDQVLGFLEDSNYPPQRRRNPRNK